MDARRSPRWVLTVRELRLWCEFFRLALPSRGRMRAVLTCRADLVLAADATFQDGELLT
jgi:hypothetical protein